ncbi:hypothetical protein VNO80_25796 [Phaseolus coccineus]|uniref:Protein kinase domain-containing protein n=1 Tax=Phaseolus coccineus TaxID=3886 RepID=A0AAN9LUU8_PHACN
MWWFGNWIHSFDSLMARLAWCNICEKGDEYNDSSLMNLEILEMAAEGGYGRVFRCRDVDSGALVAMKEITIIGMSQGVPSAIIREVSFLKDLHHDNIVRLLRVGFTENRYVNLIFEHLDFDLHEFISNSRFSKDALTVKSFMYQILSAVEFCHSRKVLHRDLKPRNVLIHQATMLIKLADFGLAREFRDDMMYSEKLGTSWYRAPEVLCDNYQYSAAIDLWSVGCIFAEMVLGEPLFQMIKARDELDAIFRLLGTPTEETWPGVSGLMPNLHLFPNFHPLGLESFLPELERNGLNLLSRMLCMDPNKRISATAALKHPYFMDEDFNFGGKPMEPLMRCIPFP